MEQKSSNATTITDEDSSSDDVLEGHFVAGCFFLTFGGFFLGLAAYRLNRIAAALAFLERSETSSSPRTGGTQHAAMVEGSEEMDDDDHHLDPSEATDGEDPADYMTLWARTYCRQHIPECEAIVVQYTSLVLLASTVGGFILESIWGILMHGGDHQDEKRKFCRFTF